MIRNILIACLCALGAVQTASAQRVSFDFARGGVRLHIGGGHDARVGHEPRGGHWELRRERVYVEGCEHIEHVPAVYEWRRDACGRMVRVCVQPAYDRVVREPGHYEWRETRVWVSHCR